MNEQPHKAFCECGWWTLHNDYGRASEALWNHLATHSPYRGMIEPAAIPSKPEE